MALTINDIKPYPKNAKKHPEKQLLALANIVREVGWRQPALVNLKGIIIAGHGRWFAWQGYASSHKLPTIWAIDTKGRTVCGEADKRPMTPEQEMAYRLADNKLNESEWDMDLAIPELKLLSPELFELTGFDHDLLLDPDEKDDEVPETPKKARSKVGDLYQLGQHYLLCGDSTREEDVLRLLGGVKADMVFTDPPYNVAYTGMRNSKQWKPIANDNMDSEQFEEFLRAVFKNYQLATKPSAAFYICHADNTHKEFRLAIEAEGLEWRTTIIWVKNSSAYNFAQYKSQHEPIFYCFKKGKTVKWYGDHTETTTWKENWSNEKIVKWFRQQQKKEQEKGITTVWEAKKDRGDHPTIKPVELILKALANSSRRGGVILDLFMGSGSTMIACEKAGRISYGMELEPQYIDVAVERYVDYTGDSEITKNGKKLTWQPLQSENE